MPRCRHVPIRQRGSHRTTIHLSSPLLYTPLGLASSCFLFQAQSPWSLLQEPSWAPTRPGSSPLCSKTSHIWLAPSPDHVRVRTQPQSGVQLWTPWTVAHQAPLSMGFSRQEHWGGMPFPPPGDLPDPRAEPASPSSPASASRLFTIESPGKPQDGVLSLHCNYPCVQVCLPHQTEHLFTVAFLALSTMPGTE